MPYACRVPDKAVKKTFATTMFFFLLLIFIGDHSAASNFASNIIWNEGCQRADIINWGYPERFFISAGTEYNSGCGQEMTRALLYFNEINDIPQNVTIHSVKLKLFGVINDTSDPHNWMGFNSARPNDLWVRRITSPWNSNTTNWNNQPSTTAFNAATIPGITSWIEYNPVIDVTALVRNMLVPGQLNYGFMFQLKTEQPYRAMTFYSFSNAQIQLRPKLEIITGWTSTSTTSTTTTSTTTTKKTNTSSRSEKDCLKVYAISILIIFFIIQ
ncbi:unnamed protein product [Adineta ricciae]|uniref:Carbohydrate-binding module family 96 domain-containing protein n=1 Tax=Adineta ricciae TaxID=249248 RepID=A0A813WQ88_ADIRI|nr:unnamed protein product [Adineta ricciae]CAF1430782.1 unnamed protein product [Adineta ricciae]